MKIKKNQKKKNKTTPSQLSLVFIGKNKDFLLENLSMLVSSGMGVVPSLLSIQKEIRSKRMKKILGYIIDDVEGGSPLYQALERTTLFKQNAISLVRIGEETGKLSENLRIVALQEEKNKLFKSKIQSAMMYPILVLSLMAFVGTGIAWFILPRLSTVFSQLQLELPLLTRGVLRIGDFLAIHGTTAVPIAGALFFLIMLFVFVVPKTKFIGQWFLLHIPFIKGLVREIELARFGYLLGTLLGAGVQVTESLESLSRSTDFRSYQKLYNFMYISISDGNSFRSSFDEFPSTDSLIPNPIQQLVIAGEQSGNLPDMLLKIGTSNEARIDQTTKNLSVILEPILLIIVWIGVVLIALAVIVPVYSLIGGLNAGGVESNPRNNQNTSVQENAMVPVVPQENTKKELVVYIVIDLDDDDYVNVRSEPSTEGEIIEKAFGTGVYQKGLMSEDGEWVQIYNEDGLEIVGWVSASFTLERVEVDQPLLKEGVSNAEEEIILEDEDMTPQSVVNVIEIDLFANDSIFVRSIPSTEGDILGRVFGETFHDVIAVSDDGEWYQIVLDDGEVGWIAVVYTQE